MIKALFICVALLICNAGGAWAGESKSYSSVETVRGLLEASSADVSFADAKLAIDAIVDPSTEKVRTLDQIERMVATVKRMLATIPASEAEKSIERMKALKAFIYRPGHWNDNRPFQYDLDDPYGQNFKSRLLTNYLDTRKGNCISMPILFLVLGERLGLDLSLSKAPLHVFVKYTDDQTGETYNLETTSGAGFTRDAWYQKKSPMTQQAINNGVYLKNLSRKETIAVMAMIVVEHFINVGRHEEAIAVSNVVLDAYPAHAYALAKKGTAYYHLLKSEFIDKYPDQRDIPANEISRAIKLSKSNQLAFRQAESLGWRQPTLPTQ